MRQLNWKHAVSCTILGVLFPLNDLEAAAFRLRETNASGVGRAMAGEAAAPEGTAAEQFDNAASLGFLDKSAVEVSTVYLRTKAAFTKDVATNPFTAGAGAIDSSKKADGGGNFVIPSAYLAWKASKSWTLGFGFTAPWGLRTEYDRDWVGKSRAILSDMQVFNFNPAVAWRINKYLAVGAGFNFQHASAELSRNLNVAGGVVNADATIKGKSWGYGGNFGVLVAPTETTKVGLGWRTAITQKVKGDITYANRTTYNAGAMRAAGIVLDGQDAEASMKLPDIFTLSGSWDVNKSWRLLGTIEWTRWSILRELQVKFPGSGAKDSVETFAYKNSMFYSLGAIYSYNKHWSLKGGIAYDVTPTSLEHRSPRIPDENRTWFSIGADYKHNDHLSFSLSYTYVYLPSIAIDLKTGTSLTSPDATKGTLKGKFSSDSHLIGARLTWRI